VIGWHVDFEDRCDDHEKANMSFAHELRGFTEIGVRTDRDHFALAVLFDFHEVSSIRQLHPS